MDRQNVTVSLSRELLRKVKLLATQRNTSISGILTLALEELVNHEEDYQRARQQHLDWLAHGADLGTRGIKGWRREDLHERAG